MITVDSCSYVAPKGGVPASLSVVLSQDVSGKPWVRQITLTGDSAKNLWDQYTEATEQSTIENLLAQ